MLALVRRGFILRNSESEQRLSSGSRLRLPVAIAGQLVNRIDAGNKFPLHSQFAGLQNYALQDTHRRG